MGLSASQARYLQLTARRSDNEYRAQQINQRRNDVAKRLSDASLSYSEGINNRRLMFSTPTGNGTEVNKVPLDYKTITSTYPAGLGYTLINKEGAIVRPVSEDAAKLAEELKAQADKEYESKTNQKYFYTNVENERGEKTKEQVTGNNFASLVGFNNPVVDAEGKEVDQKEFLTSIKDMDSVSLNKFWTEKGYSFADKTATKMFPEVDTSVMEAAKEARDKMYAEAEEILSKPYCYDDRCNDNDYLETQLRTGNWTLLKPNEDQTGTEEINYSSVGNIVDELDTSDDASVTATYEYLTDYWQQKDKELELELQQIQSEHNAIETEIDSVKKVIEKNVDKSFKTFG